MNSDSSLDAVQDFRNFSAHIYNAQADFMKTMGANFLDPGIAKLFKELDNESFVVAAVDALQSSDVFPDLYHKWQALTNKPISHAGRMTGKVRAQHAENVRKSLENLRKHSLSLNRGDHFDAIVQMDRECTKKNEGFPTVMHASLYDICIFPKRIVYQNGIMKTKMENMEYKWAELAAMIGDLQLICPTFGQECMKSVQISWTHMGTFMRKVLNEYQEWFSDFQTDIRQSLGRRAHRPAALNIKDEYVYLMTALPLFCSFFFEMANMIHCVYAKLDAKLNAKLDAKLNVRCVDALSEIIVFALTVLRRSCLPNDEIFYAEVPHLRLGYEKIDKLLRKSLEKIKRQKQSKMGWGSCYFDCMNKYNNEEKCERQC